MSIGITVPVHHRNYLSVKIHYLHFYLLTCYIMHVALYCINKYLLLFTALLAVYPMHELSCHFTALLCTFQMYLSSYLPIPLPIIWTSNLISATLHMHFSTTDSDCSSLCPFSQAFRLVACMVRYSMTKSFVS